MAKSVACASCGGSGQARDAYGQPTEDDCPVCLGWTPPTSIGGCEVYVNGDPLTLNGEQWVTLCPEDGEDERLWEFSLTTGRTVQTAS